MLYNSRKCKIVAGAFLVWGLISCSPEKSSAPPAEGMLVHAPTIVHADKSQIQFGALKENAALTLNMDDQMIIRPAVAASELSDLQVVSACEYGSLNVSRETVTLPFSENYLVSRFFTSKTLFNDTMPGAKSLDCRLDFKVIAKSGSTHSFNLPQVHLNLEYMSKSPIQALLGNNAAPRNNANEIRINYSSLNEYHFEFADQSIKAAKMVCETKVADLTSDLFGRSLDSLTFTPRFVLDAKTANERNATQQYCRMLGYRDDGSVGAISDAILMRMADPAIVVSRLPNVPENDSIFNQTRRDFNLYNQTENAITIAIPTGSALKSHLIVESIDYNRNGVSWEDGYVANNVLVVGHPSKINAQYVVLTIDPVSYAHVATIMAPEALDCGGGHQLEGFQDELVAPEVSYYVIQNPDAPIDAANILYTARLEPHFAIKVDGEPRCKEQICNGRTAGIWRLDGWVPFIDKYRGHDCVIH